MGSNLGRVKVVLDSIGITIHKILMDSGAVFCIWFQKKTPHAFFRPLYRVLSEIFGQDYLIRQNFIVLNMIKYMCNTTN